MFPRFLYVVANYREQVGRIKFISIMKTLRLIGTTLLMVVLCLNFTACGDDDDENPLIGTWQEVSTGDYMVWTFNGGGTGTEQFYYNGELDEQYSFNYTYDSKTSKLVIDYGESDDHGEIVQDIDSYTISIKGSTMTVKDESGSQSTWNKK